MDLNKGLYDEIITSELDGALEELNSRTLRARSIDLSKDSIATRVSELVQFWIYETLENSKEPEHLSKVILSQINEILKELDPLKFTGDSQIPLYPMEILAAVEKMSPSGDPITIQEPLTPIREATLHTNEIGAPRLELQIKTEIDSADEIDVILAFIRYSGIRNLMSDLKNHIQNGGRIRVLTTTYTNTTEAKALEELISIGAEVKVSYDTTNTRLHAKGWHFKRDNGLSTIYIGSSNLTHSGQVTGREWNVKLSEITNPEITETFERTFEQYWENKDFEPYDSEKFIAATKSDNENDAAELTSFDINPRPFQRDILEKLRSDRNQGFPNNLVVAATGTGKTVVSAFDYLQLQEELNNPRLLFVAHRKEIIEQSRNVFRNIIKDASFGELWVGGKTPKKWNHVFASIQSITSNGIESLDPQQFDMVIIDEFHHAGAKTYEQLLSHIKPRYLLGLTATPERMDGLNILKWFDNRISYELRLWDALAEELLVPFHYYGVFDGQDLSQVNWRNGRYDSDALTNLYTADDVWARKVITEVQDKCGNVSTMKLLGFCVTIRHANFMASQFNDVGIHSASITSATKNEERAQLLSKFRKGEIKALFTVDLFNEGVDIPEINMIAMLRPTESATIFLQQLGRGLRTSRGKNLVTILDFVGHHNKEFRFDLRFTKLLGRTRKELESDIQSNFPFLPSGCHFELDEISKDIVLKNIRNALPNTWKLQVSELASLLKLKDLSKISLKEYLQETGQTLDDFYNSGKTWTALKREVGLIETSKEESRENKIGKSISRFLHLDDADRIQTYTKILASDISEHAHQLSLAETRQAHGLLLGLLPSQGKYAKKYPNLRDALKDIAQFSDLRSEFVEVLEILQETNILHVGKPLTNDGEIPLRLHSRYSRDEILAAYGMSELSRPHNLVAGVLYSRQHKTDMLFITLKKEEKDFLPIHRYSDYPINESFFHWESQASTTLTSATGQRYLNHQSEGTKVTLFVRETKKNSQGNTMPYFALGHANYYKHQKGKERPIQITWELQHRLPGRALTSFKEAVA